MGEPGVARLAQNPAGSIVRLPHLLSSPLAGTLGKSGSLADSGIFRLLALKDAFRGYTLVPLAFAVLRKESSMTRLDMYPGTA